MKYNNTLFNKFFNTINNNTNNTTNNNNTKKDINIKVSPPTTNSITNMATVTNNTPISNSPLATCTRFTDEYDLKEELGK